MTPGAWGADSRIELRIDEVHRGSELVMTGRLDARSAPYARDALRAAMDSGSGRLVLLVEDLQIWDAAGLGVFVGLSRTSRQQGRPVVLTDVPEREQRLLRATRLHRLMEVPTQGRGRRPPG
jgi:anti-anti-sigma factor